MLTLLVFLVGVVVGVVFHSKISGLVDKLKG
jgi:hypothetical protein